MIRLAAILWSVLCAFAVQADGVRRLSDSGDLLGWEAVGRLDIQGAGYCTGTLIAPDLVLTAAHCAFDSTTGRPYPSDRIMFRAGLRDGVSIADRGVAQVAVPPEFEPKGAVSRGRIRVDVALMRLAEPISVAQANPFALHSGDISNAEVSVSSFGRGRSEAISRERSCQILWQDAELFAFDCDVTFGSSGSALMARVGDRGRILAVVSAVGTVDGRDVGYGMALPNVVAQLKQQLRRDAQAPKATIRRLRVGSGLSESGAKFVRPGGS
ncbi:trypsin-like serine protease [Phaeobacter sp. NW0010-22]|uniref:trypsin-like serine peptidase n=1 Tax=Phaeobacter sp. NW0010-22 TaxID=3135907 RepID=UPI0031047DCE